MDLNHLSWFCLDGFVLGFPRITSTKIILEIPHDHEVWRFCAKLTKTQFWRWFSRCFWVPMIFWSWSSGIFYFSTLGCSPLILEFHLIKFCVFVFRLLFFYRRFSMIEFSASCSWSVSHFLRCYLLVPTVHPLEVSGAPWIWPLLCFCGCSERYLFGVSYGDIDQALSSWRIFNWLSFTPLPLCWYLFSALHME